MSFSFNFSVLILLMLNTGLLNAQSSVVGNRTIGTVRAWETLPDGTIAIHTQNAKAELTVYREDIIRVRIYRVEKHEHPEYAIVNEPQGKFSKIEDQENTLILSTGVLHIRVGKKPFGITMTDRDGKVLSEDEAGFAVNWQGNNVTCYKSLQPNERFVGLGEKAGDLDRRGTGVINWNTDAYGYDNNTDPLYATIPFYMGIHKNGIYGIFFNNSFKSQFNFGAANHRFSSFSAEYGDMDYFLFGAGSPQGILDDYTWLTGRMPMPPKWALGYQQCRYSYFPDTEVERIVRTFRDKQLPADVIYLDIHYMDDYKVFSFHPQHFSKPRALIKGLDSLGFKTALILDPGIKVEKGYAPYDEGVAKGLFGKYPDGTLHTGEVWPGICHFPDFTNPQTRHWWGAHCKFYTDAGVLGFWNDMNEPASWGQQFPELVEFDFEGRQGTFMEAHNLYGHLMSRSTKEGVDQLLGNKRSFHLTRSAFAGTQRYTAIWTGDNQANDEHMLLGVRLVNSLGLSGFGFAGMDVGGFMGSPDANLYARWMSLGAFMPLYRGHTAYGSEQQEPWTFGHDTEDICRKYLNWRYRLFPYLYTAFYQAHEQGLPINRSLVLESPYEEVIYDRAYQHQFMLGDHILVAPAKSDELYLSVYFPEGTWYHLDRNEKHVGSVTELVASPVQDLPVFVRGGAVIPQIPVHQYLDQDLGDTLFLHVYPGKKSVQSYLYEDDGITQDYASGIYAKRSFNYVPGEQLLSVSGNEGSFTSAYTTAVYIWHGPLKSAKIKGESLNIERSESGVNSFVLPWNMDPVDIKWTD